MTSALALCDTHCHIHDDDYPLAAKEVLSGASVVGVSRLVTMGSDVASSRQAIKYAQQYSGCHDVVIRAGVGLYPHEVSAEGLIADTISELRNLIKEGAELVAGVGEIGLDYYYDTVPRQRQISALERLIQLAIDNDLPMSFHVRSGEWGDAFTDFWAIMRNFPTARGVLHSFTDSMANLKRALTAGLYIGVNGIVTFNKDEQLNEVYDNIPLERMVLETDAPYLAPRPYRGKVNQPAYIRQIAEQLADRRGLELVRLAELTTRNAVAVYPALA